MTSISLTALGSVLTPFTNFASLSITGVGVILQGYITKSNINNKMMNCKFAYTNYNKILKQLNTYMNGLPYEEVVFLSDTKVLDDIVTCTCPTINGMSDRYDRIYLQMSVDDLSTEYKTYYKMSEETPKITAVKKEKDPKRVEAGKCLAEFNKERKINHKIALIMA